MIYVSLSHKSNHLLIVTQFGCCLSCNWYDPIRGNLVGTKTKAISLACNISFACFPFTKWWNLLDMSMFLKKTRVLKRGKIFNGYFWGTFEESHWTTFLMDKWGNKLHYCSQKEKKKMMKFSEITDNVQFWVNILCIGLPSWTCVPNEREVDPFLPILCYIRRNYSNSTRKDASSLHYKVEPFWRSSAINGVSIKKSHFYVFFFRRFNVLGSAT